MRRPAATRATQHGVARMTGSCRAPAGYSKLFDTSRKKRRPYQSYCE